MATDNPMDRVEQALSDRGISLADFAAELGESKQSVNNWKKRGIPGSKHHKVAKALGWTVEQLLTGTPSAAASVREEAGEYNVTNEERKLVELVRSLNKSQRESFYSFVNMFITPQAHGVDIPHGGILDTKALHPSAQRQNGKKKPQAKKSA